MSGPPRVRSMNHSEPEVRPVLGPAGNKARSAVEPRKPLSKPKSYSRQDKGGDIHDSAKGKKSPPTTPTPAVMEEEEAVAASSLGEHSPKTGVVKKSAATILRQQEQRMGFMRSNLSMNASCSSDASSDSSNSRASTGRISRRSSVLRKPQCTSRIEKFEKSEKNAGESESVPANLGDAGLQKRCAWVTANTDPSYAAFHDEEWGVPVHDDRKLFELLSLCTALAELSWPIILNRRHTFREIFQDFDPVAVSKLNEKKIAMAGSPASSLLSEVKLRAIIENARQTCKIIDELGSFDKYIWGFINNKPIVGNFRYPRQVPIKTSKADAISKDLVRRGFRGVGPTVVYSFMQAAGITNDHLISCFRFQDCISACDARGKSDGSLIKTEVNQAEDATAHVGIARAAIDDLSICS